MSEIQCAFCAREFGATGNLFEEWGTIRWESPSNTENLCGSCWTKLEEVGLIPRRPGPKSHRILPTEEELSQAAEWDEKFEIEMRPNAKRIEADISFVIGLEIPSVRAFAERYQRLKEETSYDPRADPFPPLVS